jgi:hypothetical protein
MQNHALKRKTDEKDTRCCRPIKAITAKGNLENRQPFYLTAKLNHSANQGRVP